MYLKSYFNFEPVYLSSLCLPSIRRLIPIPAGQLQNVLRIKVAMYVSRVTKIHSRSPSDPVDSRDTKGRPRAQFQILISFSYKSCMLWFSDDNKSSPDCSQAVLSISIHTYKILTQRVLEYRLLRLRYKHLIKCYNYYSKHHFLKHLFYFLRIEFFVHNLRMFLGVNYFQRCVSYCTEYT